ncbi:unnamed protein product [Schistosoma bovis]|nr:unnamed protein product [Schistosoma bovis]
MRICLQLGESIKTNMVNIKYRRITEVVILRIYTKIISNFTYHKILMTYLFLYPLLKGFYGIYANLLKAIYVNTNGRVKPNGEISLERAIYSDFYQEILRSQFSVNFITEIILWMPLLVLECSNIINLLSRDSFIELEYPSNKVLGNEDADKFKILSLHLSKFQGF